MDNLTKNQRTYCMSRVKGKDTGLERVVRSKLQKRGLRFRKHVKNLPGKPDIVFVKAKVAVFLDGGFLARIQICTVGRDAFKVLA